MTRYRSPLTAALCLLLVSRDCNGFRATLTIGKSPTLPMGGSAGTRKRLDEALDGGAVKPDAAAVRISGGGTGMGVERLMGNCRRSAWGAGTGILTIDERGLGL